ncbi:hypothetical protein JCM16303_006381 [Sporobolomyces ruberrimus]
MSQTTMKAWVIRSKGQPSKILHLDPALPRPTISGDLVLVKVNAVSLNPIGWKLMSTPPISWLQKVPGVPELDLSGTIVEGDLKGTDLKVGDQVYGIKDLNHAAKTGHGVLAEYAIVEKSNLRRKPENLSFEEAAAVPLATLTAIGALEKGGIDRKSGPGKRIFINGGSGGVGIVAVQIASSYGCEVSTTCSPGSKSFVESLAPNVRTFDYRASPLHKQLADHVKANGKPFDMVFDTVGAPELYRSSPSFLVNKGGYIDIAGSHLDGSVSSIIKSAAYMGSNMLRPSFLGGVSRKYTFYTMAPTVALVNEMDRLLTTGSIKVILDDTFAFENAKDAYERSMSGRAKGKIVIRVD